MRRLFFMLMLYKNFRILALTIPDRMQNITDRQTEMA